MNEDYSRSIKLRCVTCGDDSSFEPNEDKTYIKCIRCGREYFGGYDELVELNQEQIDSEIQNIQEEVSKDLEKEIKKMFKF